MKQLMNTLYITSEECHLKLNNHGIEILKPEGEKLRIPANSIDSIVCFGNTSVTTPLMGYCGKNGISLSFFSEYGKFYGRVETAAHGNILLRSRQFALREQGGEPVSRLVRSFIAGKLGNSRRMLMKAASGIKEGAEEIRKAAEEIAMREKSLWISNDTETLRGLEGSAAASYYSAFSCLLQGENYGFAFNGRHRHPAEDPVNGLLSFLYTLLKNETVSALEAVGLDPYCGFMHSLRPGKPALALDLMEEFRSPLCDRLALSLIHLRQITPADFEPQDGTPMLNDAARKRVLNAWQSRKKEAIFHPGSGEKISIGLLPYAQAQILARTVRGDVNEYTAFGWR